jgi:hypothetical protein
VLTSTVSKVGLNSAPMPDEINELVALVILLMREDLICSESSALTLRERPKVIVRIELIRVVDILEFDVFMIKNTYIFIKIKLYMNTSRCSNQRKG